MTAKQAMGSHWLRVHDEAADHTFGLPVCGNVIKAAPPSGAHPWIKGMEAAVFRARAEANGWKVEELRNAE